MAETEATEVETMTLGEFARKRGIDSALLKLLASGGHIDTMPTRNGSHRLPVDSALTAEEAATKGRAAYDELLETVGQLVIKTKSRMQRLLDEVEDQLNHLDDVIPLGPGLSSVAESLFGRDQHGQDMTIAVHELLAWNRVMCNVDETRRLHAEIDADAEMFASTTMPLDDQFEISTRPAPEQPLRRPTPLADELPDGVDNLSPEARRTVLDLLRVLVVAESSSGAR